MDAVRVLLVVFCLVSPCRSRVFSGGIVKNKLNEYERIIEIARKEIGVREKGCENCGVAVAGYLSYVGLKSPAAWCAAYVSTVFGRAGYKQPKTAWSPSLFPKERLVKKAMPGLVMGLYFDHLKRIAHCGIVESAKNDLVYILEGNTNVAGSRNGDGVYRKIRHKRMIHAYSDWVK